MMIPIRYLSRYIKMALPSVRSMSASAGSLIDLAIDNDGIAIVTMQRPPVNSLNLDLLEALSNTLDDVSKNKAKGMVITSAFPTVFSAGIDIMEIYKPDMKRLETFWSTLQDVYAKLFYSEFITSAAINGHSPAGGCLLSMCCEHRVMVNGDYRIGLNETALGIFAVNWFIDTMCHTIPVRDAELALTQGTLFSVEEALKVGLIDEIATDKADAVGKSKKFINRFDGIPQFPRILTKRKIREAPFNRFQKNRQADLQEVLDYVKNPAIQQGLEMYIKKIKQKK